MKPKMIAVSVLATALSAFAVESARAQHDEHHSQDQAAHEQSKTGMMGGIAGQNMMGMMSQMKGHQQQMFRLMEKLMASMKGIQEEKDPAALRSKLAEHQALLNQMHDQMTQQGRVMGSMSDMMQNPSMPCAGATAQTVAGTVTTVSSDSITVETMGMHGSTVTIAIVGSTKFTKDGSDVTVKELKVGDKVAINTKPNGDKLEATQVLFGQMFQQHMDMHH